MKKQKDYRKEMIELLDKAENALIILTTDGESADFLTKGSLDNLSHIITMTLMDNEERFITMLSAVMSVVGTQLHTGEPENAKATMRAIRVATKFAEEHLSAGLN